MMSLNDSRFALPVFNEDGKAGKYNIFDVELLIWHASDDKLYLYDVVG